MIPLLVAVPRRGASCYVVTIEPSGIIARLLSPAGARAVTIDKDTGKAVVALLSPAGARVVTVIMYELQFQLTSLLSPAGARAVTAKMQKIQCGFSAFLQSFCIIFCIFAYPFVILSVFLGANLPVTT